MSHCIFLVWFLKYRLKWNTMSRKTAWTPFYMWRKTMEINWESMHMEKFFRRNLDIKFSPVKLFHAMENVKLQTEAFLCMYWQKYWPLPSGLFHQDRSLTGSVTRVWTSHKYQIAAMRNKTLCCRTQLCLPQVGGYLFCFFNTILIKTLSYYKNNKNSFSLFQFKNMSRQEIKAAHNFWKPVLNLF